MICSIFLYIHIKRDSVISSICSRCRCGPFAVQEERTKRHQVKDIFGSIEPHAKDHAQDEERAGRHMFPSGIEFFVESQLFFST